MTWNAVLEQARKPECGARIGIDAERIVVVARRESGLDPLIIGVNADPERGLPHQVVRSSTPAQAVARAAALLADHRSLDLGLTGINATNLARDGLTLQTAFVACASIRASYTHLAANVETVWTLVHRLYNSGRLDHGIAYAAGIEADLRRVHEQVTAPAPVSLPPPIPPGPPPCAPAWDGWALAQCSARLRAPTPAVAPVPAVTTTTNGDQLNAPTQP